MDGVVCSIQGVFFEPVSDNPQGWPPPTESDLKPISGLLFRNVETGELTGATHDRHGEATLSEITLDPQSLSFTKIYKYGNYEIRYKLKFFKEEGWYAGEYRISSGDIGFARCILASIPVKFYAPPEERI